MPLQNHPGDAEFPVRARSRYARAMERARRASPPLLHRRLLLLTAAAAAPAVTGLGIGLFFDLTRPSIGSLNPLIWAVYGFGLGILVAAVVFQRVDAGAPVRAQREYLALTQDEPLTLRGQQLLALDAVGDWSVRGWNSSLAFTPSWPALPQALRERHRDGADGSPWPALPISPLASIRVYLDENYRIASEADAEMHVADVLERGPLSRRFAEVLASDAGDRMVARMAALTGASPFEVLDRGHPEGDLPPRLLLAGDVERAIAGLRYAYVAGYLSTQRCWELVARVGDLAFTRFDGWDAYWHDVELSVAFRSDRLDAVQSHRETRHRLSLSTWPAATTPWPERHRPRRPSPGHPSPDLHGGEGSPGDGAVPGSTSP